MQKIYLDYAATTPLDKKVLATMMPYFGDKFGNASSLHIFGEEAAEAVIKARQNAADFLNCQNNEIIFTSGSTESNNLAIKGVVDAYLDKNKSIPHIITTQIEHHCVLESCAELEKAGKAQVSYIAVSKDGIVDPEDVGRAIKHNTLLISIMYVNNEIGTVQPIIKIGKLIRDRNSQLPIENCKLLFHTDATQAINYFNCDVQKLGVDLLSLSAHKIYGPKGSGALFVKRGTPIKKMQDGGEQEAKKRAGTLNVPGIVGLGTAVSMINDQKSTINKIKILRNYLVERILNEIPEVKLNGSKKLYSPAIANFSFKNAEGESLLLMLSGAGIAVSTGSACSSGSLAPSHVLSAIGKKPEEAHGSIRFSLGKHTTKQEIDYTIKKLKEIVANLRKISGNVLRDYSNKPSHAQPS